MRFVSSSEHVAQDVILRFCLAPPDAQDSILRHTFADEKCILAKAGSPCNCFLWACHLYWKEQVAVYEARAAELRQQQLGLVAYSMRVNRTPTEITA